MPDTPLTEILQDFRSYRPGNHREFLSHVAVVAQQHQLRDYALADAQSAAMYLQALDQVRDFRWRHWCFTREYVLKNTKHATATGGSPIVTVSLQACTLHHVSQTVLPCCILFLTILAVRRWICTANSDADRCNTNSGSPTNCKPYYRI